LNILSDHLQIIRFDNLLILFQKSS